jgi:hypothetical protein
MESCFVGMDDSPLQQQYHSLLKKSNVAYTKQRRAPDTLSVDVEEEHRRTSTALCGLQDRIMESFDALSEKDLFLARAGLWPLVSPRDVLNKLALSQRSLLSKPWKEALIKYAEGITMVQRAIRMSRLTKPEYQAELGRELSNPGRVGWDAMTYPDWLLIELESNLLVRQVQAEIASEMLAPGSGKNAVVQLNMGEGKSSVRGPLYSLDRG